MLIEIFSNIALKPILRITNAHNIQQMECWKPCNELSSEKKWLQLQGMSKAHKIKSKQKGEKNHRKNKQMNNKQHKNIKTRKMGDKKTKHDNFVSSVLD